jgi:hypothetical protein
MKLKEIKPNTYVVDFETREELLKSFIRFQEYYESPEFKDKVFTVKEYSEWYMKTEGKETFTYYSDWSGCNVPSYVFDFFRSGKMNPLSEQEQNLLDMLPTSGKFYVIGTFDGGAEGVIEHELCHSLFYSDENYKNESLELLSKYKDELSEVKSWILNMGYHESVLLDEVQAYVSASTDDLIEKKVNYPKELHNELKTLLSKYDNDDKVA